MQERLQKIIARAGIASRRAAEEIVRAGRVRVNGKVVAELGAKADARDDLHRTVDGARITVEDLAYVVLHKPRGVVSTMRDPEGRPTVASLLSRAPSRVLPVGRLDFATSGVLLATNDGDFANALLHPRAHVPKTYVVKVQGIMTDMVIAAWREGVDLDDGRTLPTELHVLRHEGDKTWFELTLREGRNQQIRRMGDATGHRVMRLARTSFAGITSEGIRPGEWRALSRDELNAMKKAFGVPKRVRNAAVEGVVAKPRQDRGESRSAQGENRGATTDDVKFARSARFEKKPRGAGGRGPRGHAPSDRGSSRGHS